jgi:hypothetical protein
MVGRGRGRGGASGKGSELDLVGGDEPVGAVSCGLKKRDAVVSMCGRVRGEVLRHLLGVGGSLTW